MQQHLNSQFSRRKKENSKAKEMTLKSTSTRLLDQHYFFLTYHRNRTHAKSHCMSCGVPMWRQPCVHSDKSEPDKRCMGLRSKVSQLIGLTAVHVVSIHPPLPLLLFANCNDHTSFSGGHSEYSERNSESLRTFFLLFEETYADGESMEK